MIDIRLYKEADRESLVTLWQTVFPDDPPHNEPNKVIDEKLNVDNLIYVALADNTLVGGCVVGYDGHRGWLYAVAVSPEHRRSGVGKQLISHVSDELRQRGCGKINLQIRADNTEVAQFYQSLGFEAEERLSMGMRL